MSGSQGSAASASSSSAQPPQPVQQLPEQDLELEGELIDADTANTEVPEPGDTQSRLQHALAALCLRHKPSETIEPRMLRVFLDRVVPDAYRIQPKDTLLAMLMHKHFSIPVLTTREAVGKTSPSKHETSYGVQYRNLCIVGPDPKYNTDRTFAEESEERLRVHYMYLKSILSTHPDSTIGELKWTQSDVVTWLPKRAEALQALPSCKFKQRMKYAGAVYNTTLQIRLGAITADHHHLWSECRQKGCVACPWVNKDGAGELFLHKGGCLNGVRGSHKFQGVSNLEEVYIVQPVLHNTKGAASRILGVIGRTLPAPYNHELLHVIAHVARRYDPRSLPPDSRQHMRHVRGRFQAGISLTGREARTVMGRLAGGMVLPLPFHSLVVAFCHMVHLCYGCNNLATVTWQAMGMLYTYIVHIIPEFAEEGCTATLYMHGWSHTWFNPRTPMLYSDEAGERDLRVAKRYAPVTSTRQDASISESLKHELYQKFVQKKKKIPCAKIWAPVQRNVVLEACMVAANAV